MNPSQDCPTPEAWREFAAATLARQQHEALDSHLEACSACQETLAALDGTTGPLEQLLAGLMKPAGAVAAESDPGYGRLIELAKSIRSRHVGEPLRDSQSHRAETRRDVLPPGTVLGAYVLGESIGAGGMGRVYQAVHQRMRRTVAVKVLSPRWLECDEAQGRFRREVESAARLSHPHVVTAFDAGEADGHLYLVMEYVPGRNLAEVVRQSGPLPLRAALEYVLQAARGLEHAHQMGIVHRDIKPGNLLRDDAGTVKVLDMGIARAPWTDPPGGTSDFTAAQALLGTVAFMAPEQAANPRRVDHRADVYSLGCTLFYLLTGRNAYEGETAMEVVLAHREQPIPSVRDHRPDCPEVVDALFQRMVAKRPEDRVATMREVIGELERQLDGQSAEEKPMRSAMLRTAARPSPLRAVPHSRTRGQRLRAAATWAVAAALLVALVLTAGKLPWPQGALNGPTTIDDDGSGKTVDVVPIADKTGASRAAAKNVARSGIANDEAAFRHVDFLDGMNARRDGLADGWAWDGDALTSSTTKGFADLALPGKPPEEYLVTVTAERKGGADALRLGLTAGDRSFVVVFDLGGTVTSLGMLESFGPGEHSATVRNTVFWKDKPLTVKCNVRTRDKRTQIDVYAGEERLVAWAGETHSLSAPPDVPKDAAVFIGSRGSSFRITRLELTPLIDGRPAPRWKTPPLTPKIELVKVREGEFLMGADEGDKEAPGDQKPRHEVQISRAFWLGKYEVTRDEFIEVMGLAKDAKAAAKDSGQDEQGRLPVVGVSWFTAVEFCNQLSLRHGLSPYYSLDRDKASVTIRGGNGFRLPTEAEWEYACRAGTQTRWHFGDDPRRLDEHEWHAGNSGGRPHPVGKLKPNPWGLYDMHGNVPEWCWDRYDAEYYGKRESLDPPGSSRGEQRVVRGGSASQRAAQSASRNSLGVGYGTVDPQESSTLPPVGTVAPGSRGVGIRVARSVE
jgi:serine/threonine protein kinase/formylglycine-generating enzyme required for sulfatase activity